MNVPSSIQDIRGIINPDEPELMQKPLLHNVFENVIAGYKTFNPRKYQHVDTYESMAYGYNTAVIQGSQAHYLFFIDLFLFLQRFFGNRNEIAS